VDAGVVSEATAGPRPFRRTRISIRSRRQFSSNHGYEKSLISPLSGRTVLAVKKGLELRNLSENLSPLLSLKRIGAFDNIFGCLDEQALYCIEEAAGSTLARGIFRVRDFCFLGAGGCCCCCCHCIAGRVARNRLNSSCCDNGFRCLYTIIETEIKA